MYATITGTCITSWVSFFSIFSLRTSETNYLNEAFSFYAAIRGRAYYSRAVREDRYELQRSVSFSVIGRATAILDSLSIFHAKSKNVTHSHYVQFSQFYWYFEILNWKMGY